MDNLKHSNFEAQNWGRLSHNSHRIIKFLLSVSLFSALISLLPLLLQSLKPFLMQFYSYNIGKSYIFLLCNGLLVFIVKNSGLIDGSSPSTNQSKELSIENPESGREELKVLETEEPVLHENEVEIEYPEEDKSLVLVEGKYDGVLYAQEQEEEWYKMITGEDEHDAEETEETEELNKKCEDFIRKMKAAFCSEPRFEYNSDFDYQKALMAVECC